MIGLLPFYFSDALPVAPAKLRNLAYATSVGCFYALAEDKIIDSQLEATPSHSLLAACLYGEFQRALLNIFPDRSGFWSHYDRYFRAYQTAEIRDARRTRPVPGFPPAEYFRVAKAKSAPVKLAVCGLAFLSGRRQQIGRYARSLDDFLIGFQLYDDALDWREDFLQNRNTLVTARIASLAGTTNAGKRPIKASELEAIVHSSGALESAFDESRLWFERSAKAVEGFHCRAWTALLHDMARAAAANTRALISLKTGLLLGGRISLEGRSDPNERDTRGKARRRGPSRTG